jgi:hypothetical protein
MSRTGRVFLETRRDTVRLRVPLYRSGLKRRITCRRVKPLFRAADTIDTRGAFVRRHPLHGGENYTLAHEQNSKKTSWRSGLLWAHQTRGACSDFVRRRTSKKITPLVRVINQLFRVSREEGSTEIFTLGGPKNFNRHTRR